MNVFQKKSKRNSRWSDEGNEGMCIFSNIYFRKRENPRESLTVLRAKGLTMVHVHYSLVLVSALLIWQIDKGVA